MSLSRLIYLLFITLLCGFVPVFQIHYLRLTTAILHHEKSRKYLLNNVLYPCVAQSLQFTVQMVVVVKAQFDELLRLHTWLQLLIDFYTSRE